MELHHLIGRDIVVGRTFYDSKGEITRQEQDHGEIVDIDEGKITVQPFDWPNTI